MAPNGNKRPTKAKKKAPQPSSKPRSTTNRRSTPPSQPRRRRSTPRACNWFTVTEGTLNGGTRPGVLEEIWLHPQNFPNTPFGASCSNHTHRREHHWEFRMYITTASTTGVRLAITALTDPTYQGGITASAVWALVANGTGSYMDSTGRGQRGYLAIRGSTTSLSNAVPPGQNWTGFASGCAIVYLLQAPVGITETTSITYTLLARVSWAPLNPLPGFLTSQGETPFNPTPPPQPTPGQPADWALWIQSSSSNYTLGQRDQMPPLYVLNHTGDAWLAGGYYFAFPPQPTNNTLATGTSGTTINVQFRGTAGNFTTARVYNADTMITDWVNNFQQLGSPHYFVIYRGAISGTYSLVGFSNYEQAKRMADGDTGAVASGQQLALDYLAYPSWLRLLGHEIPITSSGNVILRFTTVYTSPTATKHQLYSSLPNTSTGLTPLSLDVPDAPNGLSPRGQTPSGSASQMAPQASWANYSQQSTTWLRRRNGTTESSPRYLPQPTPTSPSLQQNQLLIPPQSTQQLSTPLEPCSLDLDNLPPPPPDWLETSPQPTLPSTNYVNLPQDSQQLSTSSQTVLGLLLDCLARLSLPQTQPCQPQQPTNGTYTTSSSTSESLDSDYEEVD